MQDPGAIPQAALPQPQAPAAAANENPAGGGDGAPAAAAPPSAASKAEEDASVSWNDIKSVQNLIERCLQKFMTQTEIIAALQVSSDLRDGCDMQSAQSRIPSAFWTAPE